jgi:predicted chitinase
MHIIKIKNKTNFKFEDSSSNATELLPEIINKAKDAVSKLTLCQKLLGIGGTLIIAGGGINNLLKSELGIESDPKIVQTEINKISEKRDSEKDPAKKSILQKEIDRLAAIRNARKYILEIADGDDSIKNELTEEWKDMQEPVLDIEKLVTENPDKFVKRKFYREIQNGEQKLPIFLSEGHIEAIKVTLDLIKSNKIRFPDDYSLPKESERNTYGVNSEKERHIKYIEEGRIPYVNLQALIELTKKFDQIYYTSGIRDFEKGAFKGQFSMHVSGLSSDISAVVINGKEVTSLDSTDPKKGEKVNSRAAYTIGNLAKLLNQTGSVYQVINSEPIIEPLTKLDPFSTTINRPESGKTFVAHDKNHHDHQHFTTEYTTKSYQVPMSRAKFNRFIDAFNQLPVVEQSPNLKRYLRYIIQNNVTSIFDNPDENPIAYTQLKLSQSEKLKPVDTKETIKSLESFNIDENRIIAEAKKQGVTNINQIAYILATAKHETGTFNFMEELGAKEQATKLGYDGGVQYYGRGYVQLTHKYNYIKYSKLTNLDLVNNPSLVSKDRDLGAYIAVHGMINGNFTPYKLSQFINENNTDFVGARKVVNGMDKAGLIARYAELYKLKLSS